LLLVPKAAANTVVLPNHPSALWNFRPIRGESRPQCFLS